MVDWATLIWRPCIPPSHSFIFWRLMHKKLPTDEHLRSRGCTIVSICVLCYRSAETSEHLFFSCDYAVCLWCWLGALLHCSFPLQSPEALLSCVPAVCTSQLRDVYVSAIVHVLHTIWLARNEIRFGSCIIIVRMAQNQIIVVVSMSGSQSTSYCIPTDTSLLENFHVSPSFRRFKEIILVVWKPPTTRWVKANTDGSLMQSSASCGCIFRDHKGTFLGCSASNLGTMSIFEAELSSIIFAMEFAARYDWLNLWVESDSSSVVLAFKNSKLIPVRLRNRWHNCFQLGITTICSHIYREGNCCGDKMASLGHDLSDTIWFDVLPPSLSLDFFRDRNGLPNYRFP